MSCLKVEIITVGSGLTTLNFLAASNRSYSILVRNVLGDGSWAVHAHLDARPTNWTAIVSDPLVPGEGRYHRLVVPQQR